MLLRCADNKGTRGVGQRQEIHFMFEAKRIQEVCPAARVGCFQVVVVVVGGSLMPFTATCTGAIGDS